MPGVGSDVVSTTTGIRLVTAKNAGWGRDRPPVGVPE